MSRMGYNYNQFYRKWSFFHSLTNIVGLLIIVLGIGNMNIWLIGVCITFTIYIWHIPEFTKKASSFLSYANWVTIFRLVIILALSFSFEKYDDIFLFIGFLIAILLDGVDGYLARKYNQSSPVGENIDMETDAFMVLLLSYIHYSNGYISWWILIPGGLRYYSEIFVIKLRRGKDIPKKVRSTIAVIFFISLLSPFVLPKGISQFFLVMSSLAICLSFTLPTFLGDKILSKNL